MVSDEDKRSAAGTQQENPNPDKLPFQNPLITFRRFVDETIGYSLQSLIGLPSAVTKQFEGALPALDKIRSENVRKREELLQEAFRREQQRLDNVGKTASDQEGEAPHEFIEELKRHREQHRKRWQHIKEAIHQGPDAGYTPDEMARRGNVDSNGRWAPMETFSGDFPLDSLPHAGMHGSGPIRTLPHFLSSLMTHIISDGMVPGMVPYLLLSPYSPLQLSIPGSDHYLRSQGVKDSFPYCDAFEDLLLASSGREMISPEERRRRQDEARRTRENILPPRPGVPFDPFRYGGFAISWLDRLEQQGLIERTFPTREQLDEDDGTELAMYGRFLSSAFPKAAPKPPEVDKGLPGIPVKEPVPGFFEGTSSAQQNASPDEGVLSTLTRTESKRYPDGRIETKVVLIKRFANGSESKVESIHTKHEDVLSDEKENKSDDNKQNGNSQKKGWFWN